MNQAVIFSVFLRYSIRRIQYHISLMSFSIRDRLLLISSFAVILVEILIALKSRGKQKPFFSLKAKLII